jgi:hypothetical protein
MNQDKALLDRHLRGFPAVNRELPIGNSSLTDYRLLAADYRLFTAVDSKTGLEGTGRRAEDGRGLETPRGEAGTQGLRVWTTEDSRAETVGHMS